ncbi:MAG: hypothetical protein IKD59_05475 [Lachnospiraceae bacterium]|nr:hypothetical protein [Lachnospiraceae bacterium]
MRLVNADDAPWYVNKMGCQMMRDMPTVDAIPVEWVKTYVKTKAEETMWSEDADFLLDTINDMVAAWLQEDQKAYQTDKRRDR